MVTRHHVWRAKFFADRVEDEQNEEVEAWLELVDKVEENLVAAACALGIGGSGEESSRLAGAANLPGLWAGRVEVAYFVSNGIAFLSETGVNLSLPTCLIIFENWDFHK